MQKHLNKTLRREIYYKAGPRFRRILRRLFYLPEDTFRLVSGKNDSLNPPKGRVFIGSGDFKKQGENILKQLVELGGLKPGDRVLDIGCGIGRLAVPLTNYLDLKGSYEGFDVVKAGITWCRKNISKKFPNFNFIHIDLKNELYNLETEKRAKDFVFPYKNDEFNFAFLTSVFTHMMPEDMDSYLKQIHRVLKSGGVCFATFFIMNEENERLMNTIDGLRFDHKFENYYLHNPEVKEANIAFDEQYLDQLFSETGFTVVSKHFGHWSGRDRKEVIDFQDIVILRKNK